MWGFKNNGKVETKYPDIRLYQEIIFLQHYANSKWIVENVKPFYEPMIKPTREIGRHLFWSNFYIGNETFLEADINQGNRDEWSELHGFDLSQFKLNSRKDSIYRNCVYPELGLYLFNCAKGIINSKQTQLTLWTYQ